MGFDGRDLACSDDFVAFASAIFPGTGLGVGFKRDFGVGLDFGVAFGTGVSIGVVFGNSISLLAGGKRGCSFSLSSGTTDFGSADGPETSLGAVA